MSDRIKYNIVTNFSIDEKSVCDAENSALELILKAREKVTTICDEALRILEEANIVL